MSDLSFVASLVASLAWPLAVVLAVLILRVPLTGAIGRMTSFEGFGQKIKFGERLDKAEQSVSDALQSAQTSTQGTGGTAAPGNFGTAPSPDGTGTAPATGPAFGSGTGTGTGLTSTDPGDRMVITELSQEAEGNPSFTIIAAWEGLNQAVGELVRTKLPDSAGTGSPVRRLPELQKQGSVTPSFVKAVGELRDLRNLVAHGRHNPTAGEAVAYSSAALNLGQIARNVTSPMATNATG
jgi:hypothetical protein